MNRTYGILLSFRCVALLYILIRVEQNTEPQKRKTAEAQNRRGAKPQRNCILFAPLRLCG